MSLEPDEPHIDIQVPLEPLPKSPMQQLGRSVHHIVATPAQPNRRSPGPLDTSMLASPRPPDVENDATPAKLETANPRAPRSEEIPEAMSRRTTPRETMSRRTTPRARVEAPEGVADSERPRRIPSRSRVASRRDLVADGADGDKEGVIVEQAGDPSKMMPTGMPDGDMDLYPPTSALADLGMTLSGASRPSLRQGSSSSSSEKACFRSRGVSQFIAARSGENLGDSERRLTLKRIVDNNLFDGFVSGVVLLNLYFVCADSDARAEYPGKHGSGDPPGYFQWAMVGCFIFFSLELIVRYIVERQDFWKKWVNRFDALIIFVGVIEHILLSVGMGAVGFSLLRLARLFRLVRLMRSFRLVSGFGELRRLVQMMGGCFKTLFWSFMLLLLVMTLWAIVSVELVNPAVQELAAHGQWEGCERCKRSFSSVFMANLTLFQTVVAGDSWGLLALPIIEGYPYLAIIFAGALMTLVFGVLNLIIAVIVDTFAENRAKDINQIARDMDDEEALEKATLDRIFHKVDFNGDGSVSLDELIAGARRVPDFARWLRVLDIDQVDLAELFNIVDEDGSGEIDPKEFVDCMYRMRHTESKTATKIIKHMVAQMNQKSDAARVDTTIRMKRLEQAMTMNFSNQERALQKIVDSEELALRNEELQMRLREHEAQFQERLCEQERVIKSMLEDVLGKTPEVAFEAALDAAKTKVDEVLRSVGRKGRKLTGDLSARIDKHKVQMVAAGYDEHWKSEASSMTEQKKRCLSSPALSSPGPKVQVVAAGYDEHWKSEASSMTEQHVQKKRYLSSPALPSPGPKACPGPCGPNVVSFPSRHPDLEGRSRAGEDSPMPPSPAA